MTPEQLAEYNQMRQEILARAVMHHNQLVFAVLMQFVSVGFVVWLNHPTADWPSTELFLLLVPIVFAGLTFNYQANQCTMESVAKYLNRQYRESGMEWESFFGTEKSKNKLVSFTKALPIVWPLFVPLVLLVSMGWPMGSLSSGLMIVNLILLAVALANFKYKIGR